MTVETNTIGAFVSIDAGGQWHATIPTKGNRWIDMPGAAMQKLEDSVRKQYTDDVSYDSDEATLEQAVGDLPVLRQSIEEKLSAGDEAGVTSAQDDAQEVLDNFPWEDWEENSEDLNIGESREALQAFVDIDPGEFLELAQMGDEAEAVEADPVEVAPVEAEEPAPSPTEIRRQIAEAVKSKNTWQGGDSEVAAARTKANAAAQDVLIEELTKQLPAGEPKTLAELKSKVAADKAPSEESIREVIDFLNSGYHSDADYKLLKQLQGKLAEARGFDPQKSEDKGAGRRVTDLGNGWVLTEDDPQGTWGGYRSFRDPERTGSFDQSGTTEYLDRDQMLQAIGADILEKERIAARQREIMGDDYEFGLKTESREDRASLVASGKTKRKLAAPVKPPAAWFENPNFKMGTPLTVTKEGRVFGHLALWGTCHAAFANATGDCIVVPGSNADYAMFHLGVVETAEGNEVPVGRLAMETTHADDSFSSRRAIAHYENTGLAIADIHCGEDEFGIWFSGALRPDATETQIRSLKASPLSGDWRYYPQTNDLELVMALAVNMPGFAVPRPKFMVASGHVRSLVAAGILAPKTVPREKVEAAKAGDQLAIDDIKYLQKLAARERANEAKILKQRALVASGVPDKIHALASKLKVAEPVEGKK